MRLMKILLGCLLSSEIRKYGDFSVLRNAHDCVASMYVNLAKSTNDGLEKEK